MAVEVLKKRRKPSDRNPSHTDTCLSEDSNS